METVRVGDIGTNFLMTIKDETGSVVDISTATLVQIIFRKPTGAVLTKTASKVSGGTSGQMRYQAIGGDIDTAGTWSYQGKVTFSTSVFYSKVGTFEAEPVLS